MDRVRRNRAKAFLSSSNALRSPSNALTCDILANHPSCVNKSRHSGLSSARALHDFERVMTLTRVFGVRYEKISKVISGGKCVTGSRWRRGYQVTEVKTNEFRDGLL